MPEETSFGQWLHQRRRMLDLTQQELADQVGCARITLRRIEAGALKPSKDLALILLEKLNVPSEEHEAWLRFARGLSGFPERSVDSFARKPTTNLPTSLTSFIGREKEQKEIIDLIANNRLVTLSGAGGIGKSRLSIQTASGLFNDFPDGIWLVELAPVSEPALVAQVIVTTLGLIEQTNLPPKTILMDFLKTKKSLIILDNCEHLIQASAQLAETLLRACPDLHILATSREALGIAGETLFLVPPLMIPHRTNVALKSLSDYEAVQLFVERAQSALAGFMFTQDNAPAIAQICHQLDGIPLALELAAARVKVLRVEEVAARLEDRFRLLTSGARTALPRHQTLQSMIDWSYDLLSESERVLLRWLSVFAGGWTLEAAEQVAGNRSQKKRDNAPATHDLQTADILDLLTSLVNKSLISVESKPEQETRYAMLETIRQYASEKLWQAGEGELLRRQHLAYCVDLAEQAEPDLRAPAMVMWLDRLEAEHENIRSALEWALESDIEAELRLASALLWFWHIRGHKNEGVEWLERALSVEAMDQDSQPRMPSRAMIRGKALNASGSLMVMNHEFSRAPVRLQESLAIFEELGAPGKQGMAYALLRLALLPSARDRAKGMLLKSLAWFREIGDKFGVTETLMQLSGVVQNDDHQQAVLFVEEKLALSREIGDQDGIASALSSLADLALARDEYQQAIPLYAESLAGARTVKNLGAVSMTLGSFGDVFFWQGNYQRAAKTYEEALAFVQELGYRFHIAFYFYSVGILAWFQGEHSHAIHQVSSSHPIFRDIGHHWLAVSSLHTLGDIALTEGDVEKAAQWYEDALAFSRKVQLEAPQIFAIAGLAKVAWAKGDYELAVRRFEESLRMSQKSDIWNATFHSLYNLGRVAQSQGDYVRARELYVEALEFQKRRISPLFNWPWLKTYTTTVSYPLEGLAILASAQNQMGRAARLFGAAESLYIPLCFEMSAKERAEHDQAVSAARATLGEEDFEKAWQEGHAMTLEQALAYALDEI